MLKKLDLNEYKKIATLIFMVILAYILVVFSQLATILAGVAILLIGMMNLSTGFKAFGGGFLEKILAKFTDTKLKSTFFGAISTLIMQSSSLVSVITISFLSAGLITLVQGIGIIFGANLGNTASSWIIVGLTSTKISTLAVPLIVIGVLLYFQQDSLFKGLGSIFIGIGFFFLGVDYIKNGFENIKEILNLARFNFEGFKGILIFTALGALLTGVIQSSTATIALIISALLSEQISYENALAATLGTSVGGVVTALLASLGTNIEGKKLAFANCIFNFGIAIIVLAVFPYFVRLIDLIASMLYISQDNLTLKTALFHTLFNLIAIIIFTPYSEKIVHYLNKRIKAPKDKNKDKPLYLDENLIKYSDTAIAALEKESMHLYENTSTIIAYTIGLSRGDIVGSKSFDEIIKAKKWINKNVDLDYLYKSKIKVLFEAIIDFSTKVQLYVDDETKNNRIFQFKLAAKHLSEASKNLKIIQSNMKKYANSNNPDLASQYHFMRINLGELLRSIEELRKVDEEKAYLIVKNFEKAKIMLKEVDNDSLKQIENLISKGKISTAEGISILNDTTFSAKIAEELIEAIEIIFTKDEWEKKAEKNEKT